ncbi:zf-HC2 domain-containing protein [bacterium]|nr:zf-HC2 domain-containing protein [bacterium]
MPGKSYNKKEASGKCLSDDQLYRYLEKLLPQVEIRAVQEHLDSCSTCFDDVAALARNAYTPASEAEKLEIMSLRKLTPQQQVARILDYVEGEYLSGSPNLAKVVQEAQGDEAAQQPKISLWKKLGLFFELRKPLPRYAFTLALIVIGILAYRIVINNDSGDYYVYNDRLPYEYDTSGLRASSNVFENDSLLQIFVRQFKLGMSDYMMRDYEGAINALQNLTPTVQTLQARPGFEKILPWISDFYFYLGVSHFALSRSRQIEFGEGAKAGHAKQSIRWLALADSLVNVNQIEGSDRESYFLGLAYGFAGHKDSALIQLRRIQPGSHFYNESSDLIHKWSNK